MESQRIIHGDPDDLLYVNEQLRRCASCDNVKTVRTEFYYKASLNQVTVDCKSCLDARRRTSLMARESEQVDLLASALAKRTGRRALLDACPKSADALKDIVSSISRKGRAWKMVGKAIRIGLVSDDPDQARKSAVALMDFQVRAEKNAGEPIDLSELTEEDRVMILMEPAKQMLLQSAEMRQQLLADPEVRRALLGEAGVEVLEAVD